MTSSAPIVAICGTRPELIKTAPLIRELDRLGITNHLLLTGQHRELIDGLCEFFEITNYSKLDCTRGGTDLSELLSVLLADLNGELVRIQPRFVFVQGDTTSALAGALAGFHLRVPVAHIEAGLRTGDLYSPFPEEANRRLISQIATLHLTPTEGATKNLLAEGIDSHQIVEVGNTIVDATQFAITQSQKLSPQIVNAPYSVVTIHRRESWDGDISSILGAIKVLAAQDTAHIFKFVMHANPALQSIIQTELSGIPNIELMHPLKYLEFVSLISKASMILSDSGGIQEEAPTLGVPTVVLRDKTERPEAVNSGACRIGGTKTETIIEVVNNWQDEIKRGEWKPSGENPFGDGMAASRIVTALSTVDRAKTDSLSRT